MTTKKIIGLPVETQDGTHIGKIVGITIDERHHSVQHYHVSAAPLVKKIISDTPNLLIHPAQVIALSSKKMIVVDNSTRERAESFPAFSLSKNTLKTSTPLGTPTTSTFDNRP